MGYHSLTSSLGGTRAQTVACGDRAQAHGTRHRARAGRRLAAVGESKKPLSGGRSRMVATIAGRCTSLSGGARRRRPSSAAGRSRRAMPTWRACCAHRTGTVTTRTKVPAPRIGIALGIALGAPVCAGGAAAVDAQVARRVRRRVGAARDGRAERHRDAAHHLKVHRRELQRHLPQTRRGRVVMRRCVLDMM